jgi:4-carboxymuconolactone decarboxylase
MDCQHIWNSHATSARDAGVPDGVVDALRDGKPLPELSPDESAVINLGREILRNHQVSRGGYQSALEIFGQQGTIELSLILGNYTMLSMVINTFETNLAPNRTEPLLQKIN